jgi:hypothetical protein
MPAIVRCFWGEDVPHGRWAKVVRKDVLPQLKRGQPCEQHVYVYGRQNAKMLSVDKKLVIHILHKRAFPDGAADSIVGKNILRPWHYKFQMLRQAVQDHGSIIYCDWDVLCLVENISEAFLALQERELALSAYMYKRLRYPQREGYIPQRFTTSGNWLYFSNLQFIDRVLEEMSAGHPWSWHDELTMGRLVDAQHGGWPGEEVWLRQYESPIMCQRKSRSPWPLLSDDAKTVIKQTPIPFTWKRMFTQYGRR